MKNKGITILSLIVTVIIMLILAAVSIKILSGDNGLITKAKEAALKTELAGYVEELELYKMTNLEVNKDEYYDIDKNLVKQINETDAERIAKYIPSFKVNKYKDKNKIWIADSKLIYRDTDDKGAKWAEELGIEVRTDIANLKFETRGSGILKGAPAEEIETKVGVEFKLKAIPEDKIVNEEELEYEFVDWYKDDKIMSKKQECKVMATGNAIYTAVFETDKSLIYYMDGEEEKILIDDTENLSKYGAMKSTIGAANIVKAEIGNKVTQIGNSAFSGCTNLQEIIFPERLTKIGNSAFESCKKLGLISLPEGLVSLDGRAFRYCSNLEITSLPKGITRLEGQVFRGCTKLALTSLPEGITSIGKSAFGNCTNLKLNKLPEKITSIGESAFENCTNLALTSLPDGLTSIEYHTFRYCHNLVSLSFPKSLTTIGQGAFMGCSNLKKINVQKELNIIGDAVFHLMKLDEVYYNSTMEDWKKIDGYDKVNANVVHCTDGDI